MSTHSSKRNPIDKRALQSSRQAGFIGKIVIALTVIIALYLMWPHGPEIWASIKGAGQALWNSF